MVHVAREQVWLAPQPGGPRGYANAIPPLEVIDASPSCGFTADADAFAVHRAVTALATVKAALPGDCVGAVDAWSMSRGELPDVRRLFTINRAKVVMSAAIDGKRPDWVPVPSITVERGQLIYERDKQGRVKRDANGRPRVLLTLVKFVGDMPWDVARARLVYSVWAGALAHLRAVLEGQLERWSVTELLPEERPWAR
jgi:hypothetical protein